MIYLGSSSSPKLIPTYDYMIQLLVSSLSREALHPVNRWMNWQYIGSYLLSQRHQPNASQSQHNIMLPVSAHHSPGWSEFEQFYPLNNPGNPPSGPTDVLRSLPYPVVTKHLEQSHYMAINCLPSPREKLQAFSGNPLSLINGLEQADQTDLISLQEDLTLLSWKATRASSVHGHRLSSMSSTTTDDCSSLKSCKGYWELHPFWSFLRGC